MLYEYINIERKEFTMFKKVFGLFGFGCDETKVQVEALLQEVALLKEDLENLSTKVTDHIEEAPEVDYDTLVEYISYSDLASNLDTSDIAREIEIDNDDLVNSIDLDSLASSIDMDSLASSIDMDELAEKVNNTDEIVNKVLEQLVERLKGVIR